VKFASGEGEATPRNLSPPPALFLAHGFLLLRRRARGNPGSRGGDGPPLAGPVLHLPHAAARHAPRLRLLRRRRRRLRRRLLHPDLPLLLLRALVPPRRRRRRPAFLLVVLNATAARTGGRRRGAAGADPAPRDAVRGRRSARAPRHPLLPAGVHGVRAPAHRRLRAEPGGRGGVRALPPQHHRHGRLALPRLRDHRLRSQVVPAAQRRRGRRRRQRFIGQVHRLPRRHAGGAGAPGPAAVRAPLPRQVHRQVAQGAPDVPRLPGHRRAARRRWRADR
jgi:hypothetical protein